MAGTSPPSEQPCSTCGEPLAHGSPFCRTCGAAVEGRAEPSSAAGPGAAATPTPAPPPAPGPSRRSWVSVATVVIAFGAIGLLALRAAGDDETTADFVVASTVDPPPVAATSPTVTAPTATSPTDVSTTLPDVTSTSTPTTTSTTTSTSTTTTSTTSTTTTSTTTTTTTTTTTLPPWHPGYFPTPEEAIADWLSLLDVPYAGPCDLLAGQEVELGGSVLCSQFVEDLVPAEIHIWGVFATDDFGGWLLIDVGSAGWSIADESFEYERPPW